MYQKVWQMTTKSESKIIEIYWRSLSMRLVLSPSTDVSLCLSLLLGVKGRFRNKLPYWLLIHLQLRASMYWTSVKIQQSCNQYQSEKSPLIYDCSNFNGYLDRETVFACMINKCKYFVERKKIDLLNHVATVGAYPRELFQEQKKLATFLQKRNFNFREWETFYFLITNFLLHTI